MKQTPTFLLAFGLPVAFARGFDAATLAAAALALA
jgi:hypothetical protein